MKKSALIIIASILFLSILDTCYSQTANELYNSGLSNYKGDKYLEAIKELKKAIEINSKTNELSKNKLQSVFSLIGCCYCDMEYYRDALPYLNKSLEIEKTSEAYYTRGICYSQLEENENAISDYTESIKLNPDYAYAYTNRAVIYLNIGFREEACQDFKKAIELGDTEAKGLYKKYCY